MPMRVSYPSEESNGFSALERFRAELLDVTRQLSAVLDKVKTVPGLPENQFSEWQATCRAIQQQLPDETVQVAVVGPIKSGKSTFVNSLVQGDYLKRGAGVVTSIVTRIRFGDRLKAVLHFKSWEEINNDIHQALRFLSPDGNRSEGEQFDIQRRHDRGYLAEALAALPPDQLVTESSRNVNAVLLNAYLKGFDKVRAVTMADDRTVTFTNGDFGQHWAFSGDECLAAYLNDIQLEIDTGALAEDIEVADCQGSDSPNPLHLAMIQDYLTTAHFLIYVISSRTGLRQADIRFLNMIKKMGIMDNVLFIMNCDFSEHDSLDGLQKVLAKVRDDLSLMRPDPEVFAFSALYNLFSSRESALSEKEGMRLAQWRKEPSMIQYSDQETERFADSFSRKINDERSALLLRNHLQRLQVIISGLANWAGIHQDILSGDTERANAVVDKIDLHQQKSDQIKAMARRTLEGGVQHLKKDIRREVDRFFDQHREGIVDEVVAFIRNYRITSERAAEALAGSGFNQALYIQYQEFKQNLDAFMAETINPKIIGFVKEVERKIVDTLGTVIAPLDTMVSEALSAYESTIRSFHIDFNESGGQAIGEPNLISIRKLAGLEVPEAVAMMRYSAKVRTEATLRLGWYALLTAMKHMLKKKPNSRNADAFLAINDGMRRIKRETEQSILYHLKSYRENLKFQYIFKLADAASGAYYDILLDRLKAYVTDLSELSALVGEKRVDRERLFHVLEEVKEAAGQAGIRINGVMQSVAMSAS